MLAPVTVDFETRAIEPRPAYPPVPVGAAVWEPGRRPAYLAWGHPLQNNCSRADARRRLLSVWRGRRPVLFHNCKFDLDVAETHLELGAPAAGYHDTEFLAFLLLPYAKQLSLKPLAEEHLGLPPDEQAELRDWILANVPAAKRRPTSWGAYIAEAPGALVGRYAVGDVVRTRRLFDLFYPRVRELGMRGAYERELRLVPVLLKAERRGVPVATERLARDHRAWQRARERVDEWLCRRLGIDPPKEWYDKGRYRSPIDQRSVLADGLERVGAVEEWVITPKAAGAGGEDRSVSMENLEEVMGETAEGRRLFPILKYRSFLSYVTNYASGWLRGVADGRLYTQWNQVRQPDERETGTIGARTGRLSSKPNMQNVVKQPVPVVFGRRPSYRRAGRFGTSQRESDWQGLVLPKALEACGPLPALRDYVRAPTGRTFLQRDYSQQELRILAHFEGGALLDAYLEDPLLDQHGHAQVMINELLSANFERKPIKNTGFGLIYGMGLGRLAATMGTDVKTARDLKRAYLRIFPGLDRLIKRIVEEGRVVTWAGRVYETEPAKWVASRGRVMTFEYKLINYLIQGSAGDNTKQALLNLDAALDEAEFLLTVHDEFMVECPRGAEDREMVRFREALLDVDFYPPMLSEGKVGRVWQRMKPYRDPDGWWTKTEHVAPWAPRRP